MNVPQRSCSYLEERRRGLLGGRPDVLAVHRQDLVALRQPPVGVRRASFHDVGDEDSGVVPGGGKKTASGGGGSSGERIPPKCQLFLWKTFRVLLGYQRWDTPASS